MKSSTTKSDKFKQYSVPLNAQFLPAKEITDDFSSSGDYLQSNKRFALFNGLFSVLQNETKILHGQKFKRIGVTGANGTVFLMRGDYLIGFTSLALPAAVSLPRPITVGSGKTFRVKDEIGGAGTTTITVVSQGEETIDGAATSTITTNYGFKGFYTDGANWFTY